MRVTTYNVELNDKRHNILVKENAVNYTCTFDKLSQQNNIVQMMNDVFKLSRKAEEYVYILALDIKCHLLGIFEISHGTVDASLVSPREIFIRLVLLGASTFIVVHNHPSGDVEPSNADIHITKKLKDVGKLMDIHLLDHIIVGDGYYSFFSQTSIFNEEE